MIETLYRSSCLARARLKDKSNTRRHCKRQHQNNSQRHAQLRVTQLETDYKGFQPGGERSMSEKIKTIDRQTFDNTKRDRSPDQDAPLDLTEHRKRQGNDVDYAYARHTKSCQRNATSPSIASGRALPKKSLRHHS